MDICNTPWCHHQQQTPQHDQCSLRSEPVYETPHRPSEVRLDLDIKKNVCYGSSSMQEDAEYI